MNGAMFADGTPTYTQHIQSKIKTELCRTYNDEGYCKYGDWCQFAHGYNEMRFVPKHPKYKTQNCTSYWSTGECRYGNRCKFKHNETKEEIDYTKYNIPPKYGDYSPVEMPVEFDPDQVPLMYPPSNAINIHTKVPLQGINSPVILPIGKNDGETNLNNLSNINNIYMKELNLNDYQGSMSPIIYDTNITDYNLAMHNISNMELNKAPITQKSNNFYIPKPYVMTSNTIPDLSSFHNLTGGNYLTTRDILYNDSIMNKQYKIESDNDMSNINKNNIYNGNNNPNNSSVSTKIINNPLIVNINRNSPSVTNIPTSPFLVPINNNIDINSKLMFNYDDENKNFSNQYNLDYKDNNNNNNAKVNVLSKSKSIGDLIYDNAPNSKIDRDLSDNIYTSNRSNGNAHAQDKGDQDISTKFDLNFDKLKISDDVYVHNTKDDILDNHIPGKNKDDTAITREKSLPNNGIRLPIFQQLLSSKNN